MDKPVIENLVTGRINAGINVFFDITVKDRDVLREYIQREIQVVKESHLKELPPGFGLSRKMYRSFGVDPTKYRPSSEALWRRIKKGLEFPVVNSFVDLTNFLSMKFQVSYGLYDLEKISGPIVLAEGGEGDEYQGIRKDIIHLNGRIMLKDAEGAFGNPSADSLRTSTTEETRQVLQVIFFHKDDPLKQDILDQSHRCYSELFQMSASESYLL